MWLLVASALIQGSHAVYYSLSTLHWRDHGIDEFASSVLWAEGIVAEIVLFFVAQYFTEHRYGPVRELAEASRGGPTLSLLRGGAMPCIRRRLHFEPSSLPSPRGLAPTESRPRR